MVLDTVYMALCVIGRKIRRLGYILLIGDFTTQSSSHVVYANVGSQVALHPIWSVVS